MCFVVNVKVLPFCQSKLKHIFISLATDHPSNAEHLSSKDTVDCANNRLAGSSLAGGTNVEDNHWSWAHIGIGLLLVILCLSAGLLWYRIYLLHSHLEHRLTSENFIDDQLKPMVQSLYSPQVNKVPFAIDSFMLIILILRYFNRCKS